LLISRPESRLALVVVPTNEELMIAQHTVALLRSNPANPSQRNTWKAPLRCRKTNLLLAALDGS
jgi:hypothetical protein